MVPLCRSVPLAHGDDAGVATPWEWQDPFAGIKVSDLLAVQKAIDAGRFRKDCQAKDWVGRPIAQVLGLDAGRDKKRISAHTQNVARQWSARNSRGARRSSTQNENIHRGGNMGSGVVAPPSLSGAAQRGAGGTPSLRHHHPLMGGGVARRTDAPAHSKWRKSDELNTCATMHCTECQSPKPSSTIPPEPNKP